jgi:NADH dehydrogenase
VLVEASDRILPEVSRGMALYTIKQLEHRGIEVKLNTRVKSMENCLVELDNGERFEAETIVWTAGVKAHPVLQSTDLPVDNKGRVVATPFLQVEGVEGAWAAGDCAAVPDLSKNDGSFTGPSAQHAVRQARRLADNILAELRSEPIQPYEHAYAGSVASLGLHKGVAEVYGVKLRGWPAWFMHRSYHLSRVPTLNRKVRVIGDWTLALFFRREVVSLGAFQDPRAEFRHAAGPAPALSAGASDAGQALSGGGRDAAAKTQPARRRRAASPAPSTAEPATKPTAGPSTNPTAKPATEA